MSNTPIYANYYVNTIINTVINMGTTQLHIYRVWYVGSIPNCHFSFVLVMYTVCHVDHYIKSSPSSNKTLAHHGK